MRIGLMVRECVGGGGEADGVNYVMCESGSLVVKRR